LAACDGELVSVIGLGVADVRDDRRAELLALETYSTGALLTFRVTGDRVTQDEIAWLTWTCVITDEIGTDYSVRAGGSGHTGLWRGEVLIYPAPPSGTRSLSIHLKAHASLGGWSFRVDL